jgi:RPA family protein
MERTRLTAKLALNKEIITGKFVKKTGFESSYVLTNLGRRLSRVKIMGVIVDKFVSPDERYATITLDDSSETIRCKSFVDVKIFSDLNNGDLVDVFGRLREYNGEIYVMPEIIVKSSPNFETLRMLELEKITRGQREKIEKIRELKRKTSDANELRELAKQFMSVEDFESIIEADELIESEAEEKTVAVSEVKSKVLKIIENMNGGDGAKYSEILMKAGLPENDVDAAVQELLEAGICFEPHPGRIKRL